MTLKSAKILPFLLCLVAFVNVGRAQDIPAVSGPTEYMGFGLPNPGDLTYSFTGSESARLGYYGTTYYSTSADANLGYLSGSAVNPFQATYSGGYQYRSGYSGNRDPNQIFQNLTLSQGIHRRRWSATLSDNFSYLPDAPIGSLSGIPGLGDVGVTAPGSDPSQDLLTNLATRISNNAAATVSRTLTGRTTLQVNGDYDIMRFTGQNTTGALSNDTEAGGATITHTLSPIRNYFVQYQYTHFTYPDISVPFSFSSQSLELGYSASLSRLTHFVVSAGPQRTGTDTVSGPSTSYNVNVSGSIDHTAQRTTYTAAFSRMVRGGSGVTPGARTQTVSASYSYKLSRVSTISAQGNFTQGGRVAALATTNFSTQTITGSLQGSRQIGRFLSAYASYSLLKQSLTGSAANTTAFGGVSHVIAGGITYTPRAIHLSHK